MKDIEGQDISMDCTLCHSVLALDSPTPYDFLTTAGSDSLDAEAAVREYYRNELLNEQ
jgi:hypothetical protein